MKDVSPLPAHRLWVFLLLSLILACGAAFGQTWVSSERVGNEARFLYTNQVRSYDLGTKSWNAPLALPRSGATAMAGDAQGAAVAYGTSVYRYGSGFTGESLLGTVASPIHSVFLDGNVVIAVHSVGLYARITSFNRTSAAKLSSIDTYVYSMFGTAHGPQTNRLYGRTQGISPSDIVSAGYTDAGVVSAVSDSPSHGDYPSGERAWVFPDESRVLDSSGTVYTAPGLNYFGSFAGSVTDIAFRGDVPIVLRGSELVAFTANLLETGRATLAAAGGTKLHLTDTEALVFYPAVGNPTVAAVPFSQMNAQQPGAAINPTGLAYGVDQMFPDKDGNILLFSKTQMSLFRWSAVEKKYTGSFPLLGVPKYAAYSKENDSAYFAYETRTVRKMDLAAASPKETPFFNLPMEPTGLATAGGFVFAADSSGAWDTHYLYSPAGAMTHSLDWNYYSRVWEWDPVKRRMYFFRDDTSPNDLHYETIDPTGKITGEGETPYHGDFTVTPPIKVSPDGSKVVIGSGVVFETNGMTKLANLANGFSDAVWTGGKLVTLRLIGGVSQLQSWEGGQFVAGATVRQFSGTPVGLSETAAGLLVVTSVEGTPRFTLLNQAWEPVYISPTRPVAPEALIVTARSESSIGLAWQDLADNEDGYRVEFRTDGGAWATGASVAAGVTGATVGNLAASTTYEFRVVATNGDLVSAASPTASGKTLSSAAEPTGEPYFLVISRIYSNSITLEWQDNASNETEFLIYRSTNSATLGTPLQAPVNSTSFTDSGRSPGTRYYYRIQVANGTVTGDLSAQVSGLTPSANSSPAAPTGVKAVAENPGRVAISWTDASSNEDEFIVERSVPSSGIWTEVGRTGFNKTTFADTSVSPDTSYGYRIKASNTTGSKTSSSVTVKTPKLGGDFTGLATRFGDVYHFAFTGPNRIERYDLTSRSWLTPVSLEAAPTALWVDGSGIFVAEDRAVLRFSPAGGSRTAIANGESTVKTLFTVGNTLLFQTSSFTSLDKMTGAFLNNFSYSYSGAGHSVHPTSRKVFFRSTGVSPSDIHCLDIGTDGKLVAGKDSLYHGDYPSASRTFVFPNGARVADDSGTVYSTDSLSYTNSLGAAFTDMSFSGTDVPIVLRGNKLHAYNNALLEVGSATLGATGLRVAVSGTDALVFIADGTDARGLRLQVVPLADLSAPEPGGVVDPRGLPFTPDDVFVDRDGNLLLFSKAHLSLFRWSPSKKRYLATIPLLGSPRFAAYSKENHKVYFAYESQTVTQMDLEAAQPVETPLLTLSAPPQGLSTAGSFIFACDESGAWSSHYIYSPAGVRLQAVDWNRYSRVWEWDPAKRRMYFFRDDTSPNDLHYETINTAGTITDEGETPYHGQFSVTPPIRVNGDGSRVVIGGGAVFETTGMTRLATLPVTFVDALWTASELRTIRPSGDQTRIQRWSAGNLSEGTAVPNFAGSPLKLISLGSGQSVLITLYRNIPRYYLLNPDLTVTYDYQSEVEAPPDAIEDVPYAWKLPSSWNGLESGPYTVTAPVLPEWLTLSGGVLAGTPRELDSGDQVMRSQGHRLVLRTVDSKGTAVENEFVIEVAWRNDDPSFKPVTVTANGKADNAIVDLVPGLSDPDRKDVHTWELVGNTNPLIFSSVHLTPAGSLELAYAPYVSGMSQLTARVTDASGASFTETFSVTLPELPDPSVKSGPVVLNPNSGLYEQKVTVKNTAGRPIAGFELEVTRLPKEVVFRNATVARKGGGIYQYNLPLSAGKSVTVTLVYFTPLRGKIAPPSVAVRLMVPKLKVKQGIVKQDGTNASAGPLREVTSQMINGRKYLVLTVDKSALPDGVKPSVEVSPDLMDWYSGNRHTTVLVDNANILQVRDNTPVRKDAKRFIRVRYIR